MIKIVITKQKVIKKLLSLFQTETEEITAQSSTEQTHT